MKSKNRKDISTFYIQNTDPFTTVYMTILRAEEAAEIQLNGKQYAMPAGNMLICREDIPVQLLRGKLCVIAAERSWFDSLFFSQIADCRILYDLMKKQTPGIEYLYFGADQQKDCQTFFELLRAEIEKNRPSSDKLERLMLVGLFTCLDLARQDILIVQNSTMITDHRFGKLLKYLGEHYADCSLSELADKFGYNPDYLSMHFHKVTGMTFSQKLLDIRLVEGANLLVSTELKVEEVAVSVGFSDKSWFIRKFREKFGLTPSAFRKTQRQS